jgi:hypothetical protein
MASRNPGIKRQNWKYGEKAKIESERHKSQRICTKNALVLGYKQLLLKCLSSNIFALQKK